MPFHGAPNILLNEVAIAKAGVSTNTVWTPAKGGEGFNFWAYLQSAGAASLLLQIEYSIFYPGYKAGATLQTDGLGLFDPNSTVRTNYRTITLVTANTTKDKWVHFDTPTEFRYFPSAVYRIRATENNVAAITALTVADFHNVMR